MQDEFEVLLDTELMELLLGLDGLLMFEKDDTDDNDGEIHGKLDTVLGESNCERMDWRLTLGLGVVLDRYIFRCGVFG